MASKLVPFTQGDLTRAVKGCAAGGMEVVKAEIEGGKITVYSLAALSSTTSLTPLSSEDALDKWLERRDARKA